MKGPGTSHVNNGAVALATKQASPWASRLSLGRGVLRKGGGNGGGCASSQNCLPSMQGLQEDPFLGKTTRVSVGPFSRATGGDPGVDTSLHHLMRTTPPPWPPEG